MGSSQPSATKTNELRMSMCGLLSIEFYRPYFDVDTSQVLSRLAKAGLPVIKGPSILEEEEGRECVLDLYGPFWVATTLIFVMSAMSNFRLDEDSRDFNLLVQGFSSVSSYCVVFGGGLWAFFKLKGLPLSVSEALSLCGYSLTSFVPAVALCVLPSLFDVLALVAAISMAILFIQKSTWPRLSEHAPEIRTPIVGAVAVFQFLCCVFLLGRFAWI
ncbi:unnamed protein product [Choristocarpus tenellus]